MRSARVVALMLVPVVLLAGWMLVSVLAERSAPELGPAVEMGVTTGQHPEPNGPNDLDDPQALPSTSATLPVPGPTDPPPDGSPAVTTAAPPPVERRPGAQQVDVAEAEPTCTAGAADDTGLEPDDESGNDLCDD